jgi:hypothetical protein
MGGSILYSEYFFIFICSWEPQVRRNLYCGHVQLSGTSEISFRTSLSLSFSLYTEWHNKKRKQPGQFIDQWLSTYVSQFHIVSSSWQTYILQYSNVLRTEYLKTHIFCNINLCRWVNRDVINSALGSSRIRKIIPWTASSWIWRHYDRSKRLKLFHQRYTVIYKTSFKKKSLDTDT